MKKKNIFGFLFFFICIILFNANKVSAKTCEYKVETGLLLNGEKSSYTMEFYLQIDGEGNIYVKGKKEKEEDEDTWLEATDTSSISWNQLEIKLPDSEDVKDLCIESEMGVGFCEPDIGLKFKLFSRVDENQCPKFIKIRGGEITFNGADQCTLQKPGEACGSIHVVDDEEVNKELYKCESGVKILNKDGEPSELVKMSIFEIEGGGKYYTLSNIGTWPAETKNPYQSDFSVFGSEYFTSGNINHKINENDIDTIYNQCENTGKFDIYANITTYYKDDSKTEKCSESEMVFTATNPGVDWHKEFTRCKTDVLHVIPEGSIEFPGGGNCSSIVTGEFQKWLKSLFSLIRVASIILIIVLTGMDGIKSFTSFEDKNSKAFYKRLLIRLICLAIIFLAPSIIEVFMDIASANKNIEAISGNPFCGIY